MTAHEGNHSDPGPEVLELRRRVNSLEIRYVSLGGDLSEIKGICLNTHSLVKKIENEVAELRGRIAQNADTSGQYAAVLPEVVEAAVRASRNEWTKEEAAREVAPWDSGAPAPKSLRERVKSWRPRTRKDWARLLVVAAASLAAIAGAASQLVQFLAGK